MQFIGSITTCLADGTIESYSVDVNAAWVKMKKIDRKIGRATSNSPIVFNREPFDDNWLDDSHNKIVEALRALENALQEAVNIKVVDGTYTKVAL